MQTTKKQYYDEQMAAWQSQFNPPPIQQTSSIPNINNNFEIASKAPSPRPRASKRLSQSETNLPELVAKEVNISPVNLRSHSDIRYHLNLLDPSCYVNRQGAEAYRRELDEQIREKERRRMMERQHSNGVELAPIMQRKSPSLPRLTNLSSTDVTRPFNVSPRFTAIKPLSPKSYYQELSIQQHSRMSEEARRREKERQEANRHFSNWELFWGRPGHGAPVRMNNKKENLFKLLHYHNINRK